MNAIKTTLSLIPAVALVLAIAGCDEKDGNGYAYMRGGKKVQKEMVGWIAVPQTAAPQLQEANGTKYVVLASNTGITPDYSGWVAINPAFFEKLSGVKTTPPAANPSWVLEFKNQKIPYEVQGWIAVPPSYPKIEASPKKKDRELAKLSSGQLIPTEMNGWVAVDNKTLSDLVEKYMMKDTGPAKAAKVSTEESQFAKPE